jgi:hypothetical protein
VQAFVTPYCPRRVFVTEGLLTKLKLKDDELAFILGHEARPPTEPGIVGCALALMVPRLTRARRSSLT